jgi:hypothetical protein
MKDVWEFFPCFLFVGIALLAVVGVAWSVWAEKKRTEAMSQVAEQLGLIFYPKGDPQVISELSELQLFSQGHSKSIRNMIHGETAAVTVGIFDYQYVTGHGKHKTTYNQSVISFQSSALNLPRFVLRPEHMFDKLGSVFGFQDINFDTHPGFSGMFKLQGDDEEQIRRIFNPEVLTYFESMGGSNVEGCGQRLVFFRARKRVKPNEVRHLMEEGFEVYAKFKS